MLPQAPSGLVFSVPISAPNRKNERPARLPRRAVKWSATKLDGLANVGGLQPLGPLGDLELHLVTLRQTLEALGLDGAVVDEDILPALDLDEAIPLRVVEPLDRTLCHTSVPSLPRTGVSRRRDSRATMARGFPQDQGEIKRRRRGPGSSRRVHRFTGVLSHVRIKRVFDVS